MAVINTLKYKPILKAVKLMAIMFPILERRTFGCLSVSFFQNRRNATESGGDDFDFDKDTGRMGAPYPETDLCVGEGVWRDEFRVGGLD